MTMNALISSYCSMTNVHELPYYGVKCSSEMRIRWIDRSILFAQTEGGVEGGPYMELDVMRLEGWYTLFVPEIYCFRPVLGIWSQFWDIF